MKKNFEEQALISLEIIRRWNKISLLEKIFRTEQKPTVADIRLVITWIRKNDVKGQENEDE